MGVGHELSQDEIGKHIEALALAKLSPNEQNALRNAERLVQFRDTTRAAERALYDGGTAGGVAFVACIEEETRQREIDLLTMCE
jgi:hypothetical protein